MQLDVGKIYEGKVTGITKFGAFVEIEPGTTGMVHISEVANTFVNEIREHLTDGQQVKVKVLNVTDDGKISLSIKKAVDNPPPQRREFKRDGNGGGNRGNNNGGGRGNGGGFNPANKSGGSRNNNRGIYVDRKPVQFTSEKQSGGDISFEDMLNRFKQTSDEKMGELKKINDGNKRRSGARRGGGGPKGT